MDARGQFTFYRSYFEALQSLPKKDREPVLMAICSYALDGTETKLSGIGAAIFALVKPTLDTGRKRAEIGKQGGSKREANDKQNESKTEANGKQTASEKEKEGEREEEREKEKENDSSISPPVTPPLKKFVPPRLAEVAEYCRSRGNGVDPEKFCDFYASKGWKVGNQPMKDWKAAVRTWEKDDKKPKTGPYAPAAPKQTGDDTDRLMRKLGGGA